MATQDFTTFTEVDPNNRLSVTADELTFAGLTGDEIAYLLSDKGAAYFDGSLIHDFELEITAQSTGSIHMIMWALANMVGDWADLIAEDAALFIEVYYSGGTLHLDFIERAGSLPSSTYRMSQINISLNTTYYARVVRDESVGTYGTAYFYLYSDAARTSLLASRSLVLHALSDFQYVYAVTSYDRNQPTLTMSGRIKDLDIDVAGTPTVTTQVCTNVAETTATGNGNVTDLGQSAVSQHGHCWNFTGTPTTSDDKTENGAAGATGAFTSSMTELIRGRKYYVRAYATNGFGTSYGSQVVLYTDPSGVVEIAFGDAITTASPAWQDVSADALDFSIKRGRMHDLAKVEAGTAVIMLKNLDGHYWRGNTAGDYTPNVKPLTLVRVSGAWNGTTYRRFYGYIESWRHSWLSEWGGKVPVVTLSCVDIFKSFARMKLYPLTGTVVGNQESMGLDSNVSASATEIPLMSIVDDATKGSDIRLLHAGQTLLIADEDTPDGETVTIDSIDADTYTITLTAGLANSYTTAKNAYVKKFPAALTGTRINDCLAELGWPSALADVDAGQLTLAAFVPDAEGTPALEHMLAAAESEGGVLFISGTGFVVFQDQDARLGTANGITCDGSTTIDLNTAQATFSDDGNDQKYIMADPEDDDTFIYNEAKIAGDDIDTQVYRDISKQSSQGPRPFSLTGSLLSVNEEAFRQAYSIVERYKDSALRIPNLLIMPDADPSNLYPKVLLYDLSTRINVELNESPNPAMLDQDYHIEGIEDRWKAGELWQTRWQLWTVNKFRTFPAQADGFIENSGIVDYATVHDAASGDSVSNADLYMLVGQLSTATGWYIDRGYLEFDTSAIGAAATIAAAELLIYVTTLSAGGGYFTVDTAWDLTLVPATGVVDPLVLADYGDLLDDTTSYGTVSFSTPAAGVGMYVITLNATGIAAINKTGTTRFGLRSSRDISSSSPGTGEDKREFIGISTSDDTVFTPLLAVKLDEVF